MSMRVTKRGRSPSGSGTDSPSLVRQPEQGDRVIYLDPTGASWPAIAVLCSGLRIHASVITMDKTEIVRDIGWADKRKATCHSWYWQVWDGEPFVAVTLVEPT